MPIDRDPRLALMLDAALAGARAAMAVYGGDFAVEKKADDSPVSIADRNAERAITERLAATMPEFPIVAEEAIGDGRVPALGRAFLLVDPLDGTKEFIRRNGEFTVNIALIEDGLPILGVVLAPALGLAFAGGDGTAWKGHSDPDFKSAENWRRIRVRQSGPAPVALASRSHASPETREALTLANAGECRSIGSALKLCLLAEGEADFYPRLGPTMEWDIAAGDALLRAAGGEVVTLDRRPLRYGKVGIAGMRDFENPNFLAAGDPALLKRFPFERLTAIRAA